VSDETPAMLLPVVASCHEQPVPIFHSSPEVIRLVVMMYVIYPLSLRNVEDLLAERGIDISHEIVRFWWNRFGPIVRRRDPQETRRAHARLHPVALAFG
jgi:putative transposase